MPLIDRNLSRLSSIYILDKTIQLLRDDIDRTGYIGDGEKLHGNAR